VVTRSSRHLFVQVVDDSKGVTLASASTFKLTDGDKTEQARQVGATLAESAKSAGVSQVVFDRGGNTYTGRIAAFADAARAAGLEF
jgi:large subunit ribosomal protein L18